MDTTKKEPVGDERIRRALSYCVTGIAMASLLRRKESIFRGWDADSAADSTCVLLEPVSPRIGLDMCISPEIVLDSSVEVVALILARFSPAGGIGSKIGEGTLAWNLGTGDLRDMGSESDFGGKCTKDSEPEENPRGYSMGCGSV